MNEPAIAFCIWAAVSGVFWALAIWCLAAKQAVGFWANAEVFEVNDSRRYNRAMAKLFFAMGVGMLVLGLPLLAGQNGAVILLSVLGTALLSIASMVVYVTVIERKYRKR